MGDIIEISSIYREPRKFYKINSGVLEFKVRTEGSASLSLLDKEFPHKEIFGIELSDVSRITDYRTNNGSMKETVDLLSNHSEFWVTWHGKRVCAGLSGQNIPFITLSYPQDHNVGYANFKTWNGDGLVDWIFEVRPTIPEYIKQPIRDDALVWLPIIEGELPPQAIIAGHEGDMTLYIARSEHNDSLTPGKYIHTLRRASISWGGREHVKHRFEILCGLNAEWVWTVKSKIPEHAVVAGYSELRRQPLYVGRVCYHNNIITGKVHTAYNSCYVPYSGRELEFTSYQILVSTPRGSVKSDTLTIHCKRMVAKMLWLLCFISQERPTSSSAL